MKIFLLLNLVVVLGYSQNSNPPIFREVTSCQVTGRKALCWDSSIDPSRYREIELGGCSISCSSPQFPHCNSSYMITKNCIDGVYPPECYCN